MNCLIVDDNKMARMAMKQLVSQVHDLVLPRKCDNAMDACNLVNKEQIETQVSANNNIQMVQRDFEQLQ